MHEMWKDMFVLAVPVLEKILRPVIVYIFLVLMLRLSGKRELVQLNPFDLVVLLTLSNTVQNAIIGEDNTVTGGLLGATSLLAINYLVVRFLYNHSKLDQWVEGRAAVLMEEGKVWPQHLRKELITNGANWKPLRGGRDLARSPRLTSASWSRAARSLSSPRNRMSTTPAIVNSCQTSKNCGRKSRSCEAPDLLLSPRPPKSLGSVNQKAA